MRSPRPLILLLALCGAVAPLRAAQACASCACGDPTLTTVGTEQPFAGRLRFASTMRAWESATGTAGVDQTQIRELRMDLSAAYSPVPWLSLVGVIPLQLRQFRDAGFGRDTAWGPGDVELGVRIVALRDRNFAPRHLGSVLLNVKLPTSPVQRDGHGALLDLDAQLGTGSVDPSAGFAYAYFADEWSFYASVTGYLPTRGTDGFRAGPSLRPTAGAQLQPWNFLAFRLALDARFEAVGDLRGEPDHTGEGAILFVSPDVLISLTPDLLLGVGVRWPVLSRLAGPTVQSPILQAALAFDL